jgi:hypothetical protein
MAMAIKAILNIEFCLPILQLTKLYTFIGPLVQVILKKAFKINFIFHKNGLKFFVTLASPNLFPNEA